MIIDELVSQLVDLDDQASRVDLLQNHPELHSDQLAARLKERAMLTRSSNLKKTYSLIELIYHLSDLTGSKKQRAYGYWVEAVTRNINQGQYQTALDLYDKAIEVFRKDKDEVSVALMQISQIWALSRLGHDEEALSISKKAEQTLRDYEVWYPLATLVMNTANIFSRSGEASQALERYQEARSIYESIDKKTPDVLENLGLAIFNQGICYSDLGNYEAAIAAFEQAIAIQEELNNKFDIAQIKQYWGVTYLSLGRYTEALQHLNSALVVFKEYESNRHAARATLYIAKCLLEMRRFTEALEKSTQAKDLFNQLGSPYEQGESYLIIAAAYAGQAQFEAALGALKLAQQFFQDEEGEVWRAFTDLETSFILYELGRLQESEALIKNCVPIFVNRGLSLKEAESYLAHGNVLIAKAAVDFARGYVEPAQQKLDAARMEISKGIDMGEAKDVIWLLYRGYFLLGNLFKLADNPERTESAYVKAVEALEQLRSYLMIEYRSHFQVDKQIVYEEIVGLYLEKDPTKGHEYAERAKSRALLDMLALKVDLKIKPFDSTDQLVIEELERLRIKRNMLYREAQLPEVTLGMAERSGKIHFEAEQRQIEVAQLEKRMAELWHELLSNRAEQYAHGASLSQVRIEPVQPYLAEDVLLIEYFSIHNQVVVFLIDHKRIVTRRLETNLDEIATLHSRFSQNCRHLQREPQHSTALMLKAQKVLNKFYQLLLAPIADSLQGFRRLIFVPHDVIHYLPLHALHDGHQYLIEKYEISYLPSASILKYCQEANITSRGTLAVGFPGPNLEYTVAEAQQVAKICEGDVILEEQATIQHIHHYARNYKILHLSTHANFNEVEPLFSGLQLADGWLSTLDVFDLELNADLVTLSACQTGQHKIGSGDELLGLMRAFIYAGAASLVLTHWAVFDHSTSIFMELFYSYLMGGHSKGAALQQAQLQFIRNNTALSLGHDYRHPYFWAPFFLIGESGKLS